MGVWVYGTGGRGVQCVGQLLVCLCTPQHSVCVWKHAVARMAGAGRVALRCMAL